MIRLLTSRSVLFSSIEPLNGTRSLYPFSLESCIFFGSANIKDAEKNGNICVCSVCTFCRRLLMLGPGLDVPSLLRKQIPKSVAPNTIFLCQNLARSVKV